nr:Calx-beta domain-containing protein [Marinomonas communis]
MSIAADQTNVTEGETAGFTVSIDQVADEDVVVSFTYSGVAADGTDFTGVASVTIQAGQTSADLDIATIDDGIYEGAESFTVSISGVAGADATVSDTADSASTTIVDNESAPVVSIAADQTNVTEGETAGFTVSIDQVADEDVVVSFTYSGVAADGTDFTGVASVTIQAGQTSADLDIATIDDGIYEGAESFTVSISGVAGADATVSDTADSASTTIVDNESAPVADFYDGFEDVAFTVNAEAGVLANDNQVGAKVVSFSIEGSSVIYNAGDEAVITQDGESVGTVQLNEDGSYSFTPTTHWSGEVPTITYTTNTSASSTLDIDVEAIADAPVFEEVDSTSGTEGLTLSTWSNVTAGDYNYGNGLNALQLSALVAVQSAIAVTTEVDVDAVVAQQDVVQGTLSTITGYIYLEAGSEYSFSGAADDGFYVKVGADIVADAQWNGGAPNNSIDGSITVTQSGYYPIEIAHHNENGPGNYSVFLSVDGGAALEINSINFDLYPSAEVVLELDANVVLFNGHYVVFGENEGCENSSIELEKFTVSLQDTDGSESIASVTVSGAPEGTVLTDGSNTVTLTADNQPFNVTDFDFTNLSVTPPSDYVGQFILDFEATSIEASNGDTESATKSITVVVNEVIDEPAITNITLNAAVSEEGLDGGIQDSFGHTDTTNSKVFTDTFSVTGESPDSLGLALVLPTTELTSGGVEVEWQFDGNDIVGKAGDSEVIRISLSDIVNGEASYTVTLFEAVDHAAPLLPLTSEENTLNINFGITLTDSSTQDSVTEVINVSIEDDAPSIAVIEADVSLTTNITAFTETVNFVGHHGNQSSMTFNNGAVLVTAMGFADAHSADLISSNVYQYDYGIGVNSAGDFDRNRGEVDYRVTNGSEQSEQLIVSLADGKVAYGAEVNFTWFFGGTGSELEVAVLNFYRDGILVDSQTIRSDQSSGIVDSSVTVTSGGFDTIVFEAGGNGNTSSSWDNSDFSISSITFVGASTDNVIAEASGSIGNIGADGYGTVLFASDVVLEVNGLLSSLGVVGTVEILNDGNRLLASDSSGNAIFEVQLTAATGQWEFFQYQAINGLQSALNIGLIVTDADGDSALTTIALNLPDLTIEAQGEVVSTLEDTTVVINVLENELEATTVVEGSVSVDPSKGTAILNSDGTISFTPYQDFSGTVEISYDVVDEAGNTDTAVATVNVEAVADLPGLSAKLGIATSGEALSFVADEICNLGSIGSDIINDTTDFTVESATRVLSFGPEFAGQTVTITFDAAISGTWDLSSSGSRADTFKISANGGLLATNTYDKSHDGSTLNESYSYTATLDANGEIVVGFAVDSTQSTETVDITNIKVELANASDVTLYPLVIEGTEKDIDGSESLSFSVSGLPAGVRLVNESGIEFSKNSSGEYVLSEGDIDVAVLSVPNSLGDFDFNVSATSTDGSSTAVNAVTVSVAHTATVDVSVDLVNQENTGLWDGFDTASFKHTVASSNSDYGHIDDNRLDDSNWIFGTITADTNTNTTYWSWDNGGLFGLGAGWYESRGTTNRDDSVVVNGNVDAKLITGYGNDQVLVEGTVNSTGSINTGINADGRSATSDDLVQVTGNVDGNINTGAGNDSVLVGGNLNSSGLIQTGSGTDSVYLKGDLNGKIATGSGDDLVRVDGAIQGNMLSLGSGNDALFAMGVINRFIDAAEHPDSETDSIYLGFYTADEYFANTQLQSYLSEFDNVITKEGIVVKGNMFDISAATGINYYSVAVDVSDLQNGEAVASIDLTNLPDDAVVQYGNDVIDSVNGVYTINVEVSGDVLVDDITVISKETDINVIAEINTNGINDDLASTSDDNGVVGTRGDDYLEGTSEANTLIGNAGDDVLFGGHDTAVDTLIGGSGSDIFVLDDTSVDTIQDFDASEDAIDISDLLDSNDQNEVQSLLDGLSLTKNEDGSGSLSMKGENGENVEIATFGTDSNLNSSNEITVVFNNQEYTINPDG